MAADKLRVTLCNDHFERIVKGTTCSTCPSRLENEAAVRTLAALNERTDEEKLSAIIHELHSIRRAQQSEMQKLDRLDAKVSGNGRPGLHERLTIIETRLMVAEKGRGVWIAVVTAFLSSVLAVISIITKT